MLHLCTERQMKDLLRPRILSLKAKNTFEAQTVANVILHFCPVQSVLTALPFACGRFEPALTCLPYLTLPYLSPSDIQTSLL